MSRTLGMLAVLAGVLVCGAAVANEPPIEDRQKRRRDRESVIRPPGGHRRDDRDDLITRGWGCRPRRRNPRCRRARGRR